MRRNRAKPLLGTLVSIRAEFAEAEDADAAIDEAFAEAARVHRLMSFHDAESDVSRLNREALFGPVFVDAMTFEVLTFAQSLAWASNGAFDIAAGGLAVEAGALPRPSSPFTPAPQTDWRDIELIEAMSAVAFHRPLWIDLGGVAKGFAVDRAAAVLKRRGAAQAVVNAGGDLVTFGPEPERVWLRAPEAAVIEVQDGALASSGGAPDPARAPGLHFDPPRRRRAPEDRFVSVLAAECMVADALTKVAMIQGEAAGPILQALGASAYVNEAARSWLAIGAAA